MPKKETSRIQIPAQAARMQMPKATVKLQQTQPLPQAPVASVVKTATIPQTAHLVVSAGNNVMDLVASVAVLAVSVLALATSVLAYLSCS